MKLDTAILKALKLEASETLINAHGGGSSSTQTAKITTSLSDGTKKHYFLKTGHGREAEVMLEGEYTSLNALHNAVPSLCPAVYGYGRLEENPDQHFLVSDFLDVSSRKGSASRSSAPSLAEKMAKLHTTPAPTPQGFSKPMFGFPVTTCCGDTPQDNSYKESWADFYANNRLRFIVRQSEKRNGTDEELKTLVEDTVSKVVPQLIGDKHLNDGEGVMPVVVHGDLWSGNHAHGRIGSSQGEPEDVVFDSSACYAHNEYDLGIMNMFGGFGPSFFSEYHKLCPKTTPIDEYADRVKLYELYHHLNHHALFGGGYRSGAVSIMKQLLKKYGD